jgi:hypothetical protein
MKTDYLVYDRRTGKYTSQHNTLDEALHVGRLLGCCNVVERKMWGWDYTEYKTVSTII